MLTMNDVRDKIVSTRQEIIKLQSKQAATKIEIEKAEKQLKSIMDLIDNFEVISFEFFILQLNVLSFNKLWRVSFLKAIIYNFLHKKLYKN